MHNYYRVHCPWPGAPLLILDGLAIVNLLGTRSMTSPDIGLCFKARAVFAYLVLMWWSQSTREKLPEAPLRGYAH